MNPQQSLFFNNKALYKLILPLIIEQFLSVLVGMVDIIMVSAAGESAVSGISLVDTINILLINLFSALATGGAVVSSHYLGQKKQKDACIAANQLLLCVTFLSSLLMLVALLFNHQLLSLIFGHVKEDVMNSAILYFYLTALSYPFLGVYNGCAALCRSMGNSRISMIASLCMNIINVSLNAILLYGFHLGVMGVGIATLISRICAAGIMIFVIMDKRRTIHLDLSSGFRPNFLLIRDILHVGIPTGLENTIFQLGKLLVQSLIASFGTVSIAANAVANAIASFEVIPGSAIGLAMVTVVGQAYGANRHDEVNYYVKKLMKIAYLSVFIVSIFICLAASPLVHLYNLSDEATEIAIRIILYHGIACSLIWSPSFVLPNALRATDNAKFTMLVSIISMWTCRIGLSYVIGGMLGLGVLGVWIAMTIDWTVRSVCFFYQIISGRWLRTKQTKQSI